jgi:hypothetical protein
MCVYIYLCMMNLIKLSRQLKYLIFGINTMRACSLLKFGKPHFTSTKTKQKWKLTFKTNTFKSTDWKSFLLNIREILIDFPFSLNIRYFKFKMFSLTFKICTEHNILRSIIKNFNIEDLVRYIAKVFVIIILRIEPTEMF